MKNLIIMILFALLLLNSGKPYIEITRVEMPKCPEDSVLVGTGDFSSGLWDSYLCIPFDDITAGEFVR